MAKGTPATVALTKAGVAFTLHEYDYDPDAARIGMQAAEALGVNPARLLKTLMAKAGGAVVCVLVPSDAEVSLKKLAAAAGAKDAAMLPPHGGRAHHRLSCRRHLAVRAEEARARVRRAIRAGARNHHRERRPARLADRDRAGGFLRVLDATAAEL